MRSADHARLSLLENEEVTAIESCSLFLFACNLHVSFFGKVTLFNGFHFKLNSADACTFFFDFGLKHLISKLYKAFQLLPLTGYLTLEMKISLLT